MVRLEDFTACGAHQQGHFLLSSGLHSGDYLQCALFLARPNRAERTGRQLSTKLTLLGLDPDVVVGPALGGLLIGHEVARALDRPYMFTERKDGVMTLRRGFSVAEGQSVVIIEDVVTTGKSTREVATILEGQGARVVGIASIVNRSGIVAPFGKIPFQCLLSVDFPTWSSEECPLCARGIPIAKPGSRQIT